jgi:hypothetical protein
MVCAKGPPAGPPCLSGFLGSSRRAVHTISRCVALFFWSAHLQMQHGPQGEKTKDG